MTKLLILPLANFDKIMSREARLKPKQLLPMRAILSGDKDSR
jgi:hypothetical protein